MPAIGIANTVGMRKFFGAQALTLTQQALAILATFGTDAHLYLPGVGVVNGVDCGNYLDKSRTATAINSPVGMVLDAVGTVGADIAPAKAAWARAAGVTLVGDEWQLPNVDNASAITINLGATVVGKAYQVDITYTRSAGNLLLWSGSTPGATLLPPTSGTARVVVTAFNTSGVFGLWASSFTGTVTAISIREMSGSPAINTTTAQKPILRQDGGGRYYHEYAAASSHRLSAVAPFNLTDDCCVVSGLSVPVVDTGAERSSVVCAPSGGGLVLFRLFLQTTGQVRASWRDAASLQANCTALSALAANAPVVATARKLGLDKILRLDGVAQGAPVTTDLAPATLNTMTLGARSDGTQAFDGAKHGDIVINGSVGDAQLTIIERWIASLQGRTI